MMRFGSSRMRAAEAGGAGCCGKSAMGKVSNPAYNITNKHAECREIMVRL